MKQDDKGFLTLKDEEFPDAVKRHLPKVEKLYYEGNVNLLTRRTVGVVGSRNCTQYGKTVAKAIGRKAGQLGVVLISGLAKGVDAAAHRGVLEADGDTIAVLGGGTDYFYPRENRQLQQRIGNEGLLLSLHEPSYQPRPYDFPLRNGLISALSESVAVVEAGRESGALITAECAAEQGKPVYAVPGNITSHYSFGANQLIREGALPLIVIDDLFTDMGITGEETGQFHMMTAELGADEKRVFQIISERGEITVDEIHHKTNMKLSEINGIITILEIKGVIFSSLGKIHVAKF